MPKKPNSKSVNLSFNTTKDHLNTLGLSEDGVKSIIAYMCDLFGTRYLKLFPVKLTGNDISRFQYLSQVFAKVDHCDGIKRLIRQMDKNNFDHHLFTCKSAGWLVELGFHVEFEPEHDRITGGIPDLLVENELGKFAVECKDIDVDEFFDRESKKEIANFIYDSVKTCDQLDLYFTEEVQLSEIQQLFSDPKLISTLYKAGFENRETRLSLSPNIEINIIRKPAIVGAEETFLEASMGMILEDNTSLVRLPGFAFMKGGRSIGVYGPPPNFRRRWDDKRSKSKKQAIEKIPLLVLLNGDNVLGNPELHREFFQRVWLTDKNSKCSAVGILRFTTLGGTPEIDYFENQFADFPITEGFVDLAKTGAT